MAAIEFVLSHGGRDGKLEEEIEDTKIRIHAGAGFGVEFSSLFGPGFRSQNPEFASTHRRYSFQANAYSDSSAAYNSVRQPAGENDIRSDGNADSHAATNCRANS